MKAHTENARVVAGFLASHPKVKVVHFPGVGGMLSFELRSQDPKDVDRVLRGLRLFTLAESLGGIESLVAHPASMTHASMTPDARAAAGITDSLIRLSIGVEDVKDLVHDLSTTLEDVKN
jgi:cystathionine gamma-synthase